MNGTMLSQIGRVVFLANHCFLKKLKWVTTWAQTIRQQLLLYKFFIYNLFFSEAKSCWYHFPEWWIKIRGQEKLYYLNRVSTHISNLKTRRKKLFHSQSNVEKVLERKVMLKKSWKEKVPVSSHYIEILFVRLFFKETWCCLLRSANSTYIILVLFQHLHCAHLLFRPKIN